MKILRVTAKNFRNCKDGYTIDFVAKASKSDEDKLYELQEIAPNLYTFNTIAFVGKNASGKSSAIDLLYSCYTILDSFHLWNQEYFDDNEEIEIFFYHDGNIYKYKTVLKRELNRNTANFENEHIYIKKYYKTKADKIFDDDFEEMTGFNDLPKDTSLTYHIFKNSWDSGVYYQCDDLNRFNYSFSFDLMERYNISKEIFNYILTLLDKNIKELEKSESGNYKLIYKDSERTFTPVELYHFLSSGTTKGISLYMAMAVSLCKGIDLMIDEIENHFNKTLVENMISLYKDPSINKHHATLIFSTHYNELLDLFGRQDNIWITKSDGQVYLENMYEKYDLRPALKKSKQFYNNAFDTAVNYDDLMNLKKALKRGISK